MINNDIEIIEYFDRIDGKYFKGTAEEFEEFKKHYKMYPYRD